MFLATRVRKEECADGGRGSAQRGYLIGHGGDYIGSCSAFSRAARAYPLRATARFEKLSADILSGDVGYDEALQRHIALDMFTPSRASRRRKAKQRWKKALSRHGSRKNCFGIWGFGFDAMRYLSYAHKIGDVLGRKHVLERIFDKAEGLIQYDYPFGNGVYRDDNCVFFLMADLPELLEEMRGKILDVAKQESEGELVPHFAGTSGAVRNLTVIAKCIEDLRSSLRTPVRGNGQNLIESAKGHGSICPVCRFRIVTESEEKVCERCLERRNVSAKEARKPGATPYLAEIADGNGRTAMVWPSSGSKNG